MVVRKTVAGDQRAGGGGRDSGDGLIPSLWVGADEASVVPGRYLELFFGGDSERNFIGHVGNVWGVHAERGRAAVVTVWFSIQSQSSSTPSHGPVGRRTKPS